MARQDPSVGRERALGIFVKAPVPGAVKTRLARSVGRGVAARLYRALAGDVLEMAGSLEGVSRSVFFAPTGAREACEELVEAGAWRGASPRFEPQAAGDLGSRLAGAFDVLLGSARGAVVIGTDCPTLPASAIDEAFLRLERVDSVFGPAADGGYYLVGLRARHPEVFRGIDWSTSQVLASSLDRATELGLSTALLAPEADVDTGDDLDRLWERLAALEARGEPLPRRTAELWRAWPPA